MTYNDEIMGWVKCPNCGASGRENIKLILTDAHFGFTCKKCGSHVGDECPDTDDGHNSSIDLDEAKGSWEEGMKEFADKL